MSRRLPPFAAIRAFEASARHMSLKNAADELCVTPSAISHQIAKLEDFLGTALFNRDGNKVSLTQTGLAYVGRLKILLDGLDQSTAAARDFGQNELRVLATPGFAARWLVPRLDRLPFWRDIRLRVSQGAPPVDFANNDADIVIQWGDDKSDGVAVEPLMTSGRFPVASPGFRDRERIADPQDLLRVTLLHDEVIDGWAEWFASAGLGAPQFPRGPRFQHCELSTTAAERGQGVALAYDAISRMPLASGSLVRLFETVSLPAVIYSVAYPEARANAPLVRAFRDWLFQEAAADGTQATGT